jgi:predicted metal-dependent hydrolase
MLGFQIMRRKIVKRVIKRNTSYTKYKEEARAVILSRLDYFNQDEKFKFNRVAIRDQKRCWGSCSSKGNLNFSYKLLFLPPCLRDYVVVHELCHLDILNHSEAFWQKMHLEFPLYADSAARLRSIEKSIGTSVKALQLYAATHDCEYCRSAKTAKLLG